MMLRSISLVFAICALTVAAIPSMRDELFDRSGFVNIKLSLLSLVERQLAFQRSTGCPPWWSLPAATNSSNFFDGSDSVATPCRISIQSWPCATIGTEIWREFQGSKQISSKSNISEAHSSRAVMSR